jgi:Spy/CpxP family protein refolding chaperone
LQDLTPQEQKEMMPEVIKMIADKGKDAQGQVDGILDDSQTERLKELSLQSRGAQALEDDEVAAALNISDEQKEKLTEVREEGSQALQEAFQKLRGGGGDQGDIRKKMSELRNNLSEKALAILTPDQRKQFEKMKGTKFDFPPGRGFPF